MVGCRIPKHEFCLAWAKRFGKPIITTSANRHKQAPAHSIEEMDEQILKDVDLVVDGGPGPKGAGSTIIDVPKKRILRAGSGLEKAKEWIAKL